MSEDHMESASLRGQILFGCGIVLGICLGFAAGHLTLWGRLSRSSELDRNPFTLDDSHHVQAPNGLHQIHPSDSGQLDKQQPSAVPGPFFAAAARRLRTPTEEESLSSQRIRVATDTSPPAAASTPEALPFSSAAPIDEETLLREQVTRTIIAQELPHSTEQEHEIWFDVLRGMEAADVKGILRMRKHVGGDAVSTFGMLQSGPEATPPNSPKRIASHLPTDAERWNSTLESLQLVHDILLHNLANAATIGFIRRVPVTQEVIGHSGQCGVQFLNSELDPSCGDPVYTGRALDVAIGGTGFFQVRYENQVRLTRCGRFRFDEERCLVLSTTSEPWRLDPPIVFPEDCDEFIFHPGGQVVGITADSPEGIELGTITLMTVDAPAALLPVGEGLYTVTEISGPIRQQAGGGVLHGRSVERMSDEALDAEAGSLQRVILLMSQLMAESSAK